MKTTYANENVLAFDAIPDSSTDWCSTVSVAEKRSNVSGTRCSCSPDLSRTSFRSQDAPGSTAGTAPSPPGGNQCPTKGEGLVSGIQGSRCLTIPCIPN